MKSVLFLFLGLLIGFSSCKKEETDPVAQLITSFKVLEYPNAKVSINDVQRLIEVSLPYQSSLQLTPSLTFSEGNSLVPASGTIQDFKKAVFYTLVNGNQKTVYTVSIKIGPQPIPIIASISKDTVEAGKNLDITGRHFGTFINEVSLTLFDAAKKAIKIPFTLLDSNHISSKFPIDLNPGLYDVEVKVKDLVAKSSKSIRVMYPSPQLSKLSKKNTIAGDTVWVEGQFVDTQKYAFVVKLENTKQKYQVPVLNIPKLGFTLGENIQEGLYLVTLQNQSTQYLSKETSFEIQVYDAKKPYVLSIVNPKATYKKGETILFKTSNFDSFKAKFYQVSFSNAMGSYVKTGIFNAAQKSFEVTIPENGAKGIYALSFLLSNELGNYGFKIDAVIEIKE